MSEEVKVNKRKIERGIISCLKGVSVKQALEMLSDCQEYLKKVANATVVQEVPSSSDN